MLVLSLNIVERLAERGRDDADLLITPDVATMPISDFSRFSDAYDAGVLAAEEALPRLRAGLRLDPPPTAVRWARPEDRRPPACRLGFGAYTFYGSR